MIEFQMKGVGKASLLLSAIINSCDPGKLVSAHSIHFESTRSLAMANLAEFDQSNGAQLKGRGITEHSN